MRLATLMVLLLVATMAGANGVEVDFETSDGVLVYGDLYLAPDRQKDAPLILLFHQGGGDARGEYGPLVDHLLAEGYHALAIDQRRGGDRFGMFNRTSERFDAQRRSYEDVSYCDAYADLQAALQFADSYGFTGPRVAWGSSYSAALAIRLAAENADDIDAVLAFSPASGDAMAGCQPEQYSDRVTQPMLALRPISEMQAPSVPVQLELFREQGHQTHVADPGVHGSSMLNESRVGAPTDETWKVVLDFIRASLGEHHTTTESLQKELSQ
ncbi:MAG: alpha/beta fold hydrolase [Woeseia sp.]